jgi:secreted PhoX family phosphatase
MNGVNGTNGTNGANGANGSNAVNVVPEDAPLSGVVAITVDDRVSNGILTLPQLVRGLVDQYENGSLPPGTQFPLPAATTDAVRTLREARASVLVRWFDPLSYTAEVPLSDGGATTTRDPRQLPRFGANNDFVGFLGDGWEDAGTPYFQGSGNAGWMWVNHEYVSNDRPLNVAFADGGTRYFPPTGQHLSLAQFSRAFRFTTADPLNLTPWSQAEIDEHVRQWKRQVGGSWFRIVKDPSSATWQIDMSSTARRFDGTSNTLLSVTGHTLAGRDSDDLGMPLPLGVVAGTNSNCAGTITPWGTILSGEENTQFSYGDLEPVYSSSNLFLPSGHGFVSGNPITFPYAPVPLSGLTSPGGEGSFAATSGLHSREVHGWIAEIDPAARPEDYYSRRSEGVGHRKIGGLGRARWETAAIAVDSNFRLTPNQPMTMYGADDRRNGRIYKYVTASPYTAGMTRAQIRGLLDSGGKLYVAHFENLKFDNGEVLTDGGVPALARSANGYEVQSPVVGRWIELSVTSPDIAPNAAALGMPTMTVGQALTSTTWNGIGGFVSNDDVRRALHTAANKIGVAELNRPEDLEWNPVDPTGVPALYVAFTGHGQSTTLTQDGVLATSAAQQGSRSAMRHGAIFAIRETGTAPATSTTFTAFSVWRGVGGSADVFAAAMPDNLLIDRQGGVWFGTDGNPGRNLGKADAVYYLDLDRSHVNSFGKAFRIAAMPSDAEATGPAFAPDMKSLFIAVQHPGEDQVSTWPKRMP